MVKLVQEGIQFEKIFKIATTLQRMNRSHLFLTRDKIWRIQFVSIMFVTACCFVLLVNSVMFHDVKAGKFSEASKNVIMAIVSITISYKYIIMLRYQESIQDIIRSIDNDYELAKEFSEEEQLIVTYYSKRGVRVCIYWLVSGLATSLIFPVKAFALMGYSYQKGEFKLVPMFDLTYPWIMEDYKDTIVGYTLLFVLCMFFDLYALSMYMGFDPMVPIFMLHLCGQLEILKLRISTIFVDSATSSEEIRLQLRKIIIKLQDMYRIVEVIKTNFTVLYEFCMKTTTFLLPLTAFQITESLRHGEINLEFIAFFTGVILHFFMPCYYSDLLMETAEDFKQSVYSCGWEKRFDLRSRNTLLFMMTRATKPLVISTIFYAICLDTFAQMCRDAYSIFNLMNAAWT